MKICPLLSCAGLLFSVLLPIASHADTSGQQLAEQAGRGMVGAPAPRMILKTIEGDTIDLGALYGKKAVYLKFWATWCTPCREQMPHFEHTYRTAGPDLAVIAVNAGFNDSLAEIQQYRQQLGITMPIVLDDGTLGSAFNLRVTPQHIVVGRDGRIQYVGHLADQRLDQALLAARNAGPTAQPLTGNVTRTEVMQYGIGDRLPDTAVKTLDGKRIPLATANHHQATVLVFLSPWCESYLATTRPALSASCRDAREQIEAAAKGSHVRWLGVASGIWAASEDLRKYQRQHNIRIPLVLDESGTLFRAFRVTNVPTILIADASGRITQRIDSENQQALHKALKEL